MEVVPVVDLLNGNAVRATGGRRGEYRPWRMPHLVDDTLGAIANFYRERFGFTSLYLADLDAIARGAPPDWDRLAALQHSGWKLFLDAGLRDAARLAEWRRHPLAAALEIDWIVPLENLSLHSAAARQAARDGLRRCIDLVGPERLTFSLDLLDGRPLEAGWNLLAPAAAAGRAEAAGSIGSPEVLLGAVVETAAAAGVRQWIVLDLASVGGRDGGRSDAVLAWMRSLPCVQRLTAGGGVRGAADLRRLAALGCDAVLAATSLHEGTLAPEDVEAARNIQRRQP